MTGDGTNDCLLYTSGSASDVPSLISVAAGQISQIMGVRLAVMTPEGGGGKLKMCIRDRFIVDAVIAHMNKENADNKTLLESIRQIFCLLYTSRCV